jgi:hypothetical protein
MHFKSSSFLVAALSAAVMISGSRSNSQVLVQTFTIPTGTLAPFATQNFTFNKFNPLLGELNGVTLSLNGTVAANVDLFNSNAVPTAYSGVTYGLHESVTGPGGQVEAFAISTSPALSGTAAVGLSGPFALTGSKSGTDTVPNVDVSIYRGGGTGTLTATSNTPSYNGGGAGVSVLGTAPPPTAGDVITLTFYYTPAIPEPGAVSFLAAGALGGLGVFVRRRRKA